MDKKLNYFIISTILTCILLLSTSKYLDIRNNQKMFEEYTSSIKANIIQEYKHRLKDSVDTTINFIESSEKKQKKLYKSMWYKIKKDIQNNTKKEFIKNYKNQFFIINDKFMKKSKYTTRTLDGQNISMSIDQNKYDVLLIASIKNFLYNNITKVHKFIYIHKITYENNQKHLENLINISNSKNKNFLKDLEYIDETKEIYSPNYTSKSNINNTRKKLFYSKLFEKQNWIISIAISLEIINDDIKQRTDQINEKFKNQLQQTIIFEFIVVLLFLLLLIVMNKKILKYMRKSKILKEKLENKLKESQINYRDLFYKNKSVILIIDPINGKVLDANDTACSFYQYNLEQIKQLHMHNINTCKKEEIQKELLLAKKENREHLFFTHKRSSGATTPVKIFSTPTKYKGKLALQLIVQNLDSEYKIKKDLFKAMGELKKTKLNLDITQKIFHMGDWEYDVETKILSSSKELYSIFGIEKLKAKKLKNELFNKIHPEDRKIVSNYFTKEIKNKDKNKLKFRLLLKNGEIKYLKEKSELIFDDNGNHIKTVGTVFDITELTLLKNQTHKFFNFSANLLAIASKKGKVLQVNPSWERILGYKKEELRHRLIIDLVHPDDIVKTLEEMKKIKDGHMVHYFENRCKHKNGLYKTIAWSVNVIQDNNLIYASGQDITEVKEKSLIMYQQSKMAAMGEMLGNIAHQWRQPLSIISTASSGLKIQYQMNLLTDKMLYELVDGITDATKYLSTTIDDFRDFFKPNKFQNLCNTEKLIEKTLNLINGQLKKAHIEIIKDVESIEFRTYENELMQVLINILNNARDQIIKEDLDHGYIFIRIYKKENEIIIKIKDNANGIEESIINSIFEPYFTTKDKSIGTGIGLYMSQEIISKHMKGQLLAKNSQYTYENKIYKGAEFSIILNTKETLK